MFCSLLIWQHVTWWRVCLYLCSLFWSFWLQSVKKLVPEACLSQCVRLIIQDKTEVEHKCYKLHVVTGILFLPLFYNVTQLVSPSRSHSLWPIPLWSYWDVPRIKISQDILVATGGWDASFLMFSVRTWAKLKTPKTNFSTGGTVFLGISDHVCMLRSLFF